MTDETTRIMTKADETMTRNGQERAGLTQKVAVGEMTREKALEILDEQEREDNEVIAEIDRRIEKLDKEIDRPLGDWGFLWLLIPVATLGSIAAWIVISLMR